MKQENANLAFRFLEKQKDLKHGEGASANDVLNLELEWGGRLPSDYRDFIMTYGWVTYGSTEIPGLGRGVPRHLDLRIMASMLWETGIFSRSLLPIYSGGGDWYYCLSKIHPGMPVVVWSMEFGAEQPYDEQYESWTDWLLDCLAMP